MRGFIKLFADSVSRVTKPQYSWLRHLREYLVWRPYVPISTEKWAAPFCS